MELVLLNEPSFGIQFCGSLLPFFELAMRLYEKETKIKTPCSIWWESP